MPQARRKAPFSGKAKKQQLQFKKQNKTLLLSSSSTDQGQDVFSVNYQPSRGGNTGRAKNRYALKFYRETEAELKMKKEDALKALNPVPETELEVDPHVYFPEDLAFPKRPPWDFNMTPAQLDAQEHKYFTEYINTLQATDYWKQMSYFELNLETWRQLWRVLEMCDILLLIVDVRFAGMMFPPSLYKHVMQEQKDMILVLNKVDLVPASVVVAWKKYLMDTCPGLKVVYFTSCPAYNLNGATSDKAGLQVRRRRGRQRMCAEGATKLLEACKEIVGSNVDLSSWEKKIKEETNVEFDYDDQAEVGETILQEADTSFYNHEKYKSGVLTIGCVGQPNVGKSSLMNAVMGRKVVSVSRTPGHTKHFQTIFLTPQVRLCDCPGLVFPSLVPRPVQILMGAYPIAQLREPYTTIRYLGERLDLPKLLRIDHPENDDTWSPRDLCDGWAKKRGYLTAKAARRFGATQPYSARLRTIHDDAPLHSEPHTDLCAVVRRGLWRGVPSWMARTIRLDTYRAANSLLRMALDGKICLWLRPPGYTANRESFESSDELKYVKWVQALTSEQPAVSSESSDEQTDTQTDADDSDSSGVQDIAIANKFAALGQDM